MYIELRIELNTDHVYSRFCVFRLKIVLYQNKRNDVRSIFLYAESNIMCDIDIFLI